MWIVEFWNSLLIGQQIFFCIAVPATLALIVMIVTMLIGLGGGDADLDGDGDIDGDPGVDGDIPDSGLSLFTSRGIVAMLAVMGWSGFVFLDSGIGLHPVVGVAIALALGLITLVLVAFAMRAISRLQSSGNLDLSNAIGKVAEVYLTIPEAGRAAGKVTLTVQERLVEVSAITAHSEPIKTGSYVRVVSVSENGILMVEPLNDKK